MVLDKHNVFAPGTETFLTTDLLNTMEKSAHSYITHNSLNISQSREKQHSTCPLLPAIGSTAGSGPSDPERGKGAELGDEAAAGVSTAAKDTGNPSDEDAERSGSSVVKLSPMSSCSEPLADTSVPLEECRCLRFPRLVTWDQH